MRKVDNRLRLDLIVSRAQCVSTLMPEHGRDAISTRNPVWRGFGNEAHLSAALAEDYLNAEYVANALRTLLMLIAVNTAPWLLARVSGGRGSAPMDFGLTLSDGQRLLGSHKTWRGFISGVIAGAGVGRLCGFGWWLGAGFGALAMLGDAGSSAVKRRLGRAPGSETPVIDQLPEALLPLLLFWRPLGLDTASIVFVVVAFGALDIFSARARHSTPAD